MFQINKALSARDLFILQMKRARVDDDFNPVYPYGPNSPPPFITPPFTSPDGLQEKPPGVLSLNYQDPITSRNGALTLKLGNGLNVNQEGELTAGFGKTKPPLTTDGENTLGLAYRDPLTVVDAALSLSTAGPLAINTAGQLTVLCDDPLDATTGSIQLRSTAPLGLANKTLQLLYSHPLSLQGDFLTVSIERPLAMAASGALALQLAPPLSTDSSGLALSTSEPLAVTNGKLGLTMQRPLVVQDSALQLSFVSPLRLFNNPSSLGVNFNPPITVTDGGLALNTGAGLTLLRDRLTLNLGSGLQFSGDALALNLQATLPLQYTDTLSLNIGAGLRYNGVSKKLDVDINQAKGLTWENNSLVPKLGSGLQFDSSGNISVIPTTTAPDTLWTTADPSPNCSIYTDLDARLWLELVKCGGMVTGTVAVEGLKGTLLSPTADFISVTVVFYSNGTRRTNYPTFDNEGTLANSATWGYRQGQSANTNVTNAVGFMPNKTRYPIEGSTFKNQQCGYTCYQGKMDQPTNFVLTLNHVLEGYSLRFTWKVIKNKPFQIPSCPFSYITEE